MDERETAQAIEAAAADWVARLDRADDPADRARLDAWLAGDVRRRGAFFRAQAAYAMLDRASVLRGGQVESAPAGIGAPAGEDHTRDGGDGGDRPADAHAPAPGGFPRRRMLWGGAAAAGLATLGIGWMFRGEGEQHIETAIGEIRRVPLDDGSLAAVNTRTSLAVSLKPELRRITLDSGEAWFQVAKDRTRPFVVEAGDVRVRAVGTAFSVRRTDAGAEVRVTEGVVEVWRVGDEGDARRVSAGSAAMVDIAAQAPPMVAARDDIDRALSWRTGQLILDGDSVAEAAAEFNRYNRVQLRVADDALGREKMIGRFRTNEPDAFARAVAGLMGARVETAPDLILLSRD
ncbi:FecR family protein [Sphingomonas colocasiae]|uniref:FecR domain-containing protein n=1 Tax=Sphingomonas colocasiae TaxID=1848973 RepID=A0ABS7PUD7_9SPHN|nr:FecR domain-containing protein [Sphingomonas colocasiae]MBY8824966.1 FecR domain-containing protein [Sphingomonas colocasiae]